ncbi:MAG TPA: hypothetical protein VIW29_13845 [Polyangiaceae bacterium]
MSSASEPESASQATPPPEPAPGDRPKKKKLKAKLPPAPPPSEDQIDSPNRQTIGMLGVIGILTFFMWIFARGGCNYHPPKETRDPRKVELVDLARDPKDAAMEFELRLSTKSFGGAMELAKGPMVESVRQQEKACDADPGCAQRASDLRASVQVAAQLLERDATRSTSRVITHGISATPQSHIIRVERDGQVWKVVSRETDDGTFKPRPQPQAIGGSVPGQLILRQPGMPEPAGTKSAVEPKH